MSKWLMDTVSDWMFTKPEQPLADFASLGRFFTASGTDYVAPVIKDPRRVLVGDLDVTTYEDQRPMTEQEWLASEDPAAMLAFLQGGMRVENVWGPGASPTLLGIEPCRVSDRKLRLFACACRRRVPGLPWDGESAGWQEMEYHPERKILANGAGPHTVTAMEHARLFLGRQENPSQQEMAALLRDIVGSPFRPVTLPEEYEYNVTHCGFVTGKRRLICPWLVWNDGLGVRLAQAAYDERPARGCPSCRGSGHGVLISSEGHGAKGKSVFAKCKPCHGTGRIENGTLGPQRLAVLSDALEEAGCQEEAILRHLRDEAWCSQCGDWRATVGGRCVHCGLAPLRHAVPGPHVRGCWVLDMLLGKE